MASKASQKIFPHIWYAKEAEEAARYYASIFPDSRIDRVTPTRWGLLDALAATGLLPICRRMTLDVGPFALRGTIPGANRGRGGFCPRRTVLDNLLVNAAARSGAEVRESFTVDDLLFANGAVVGIRGRSDGGRQVEERARMVIGADGIHSFVARTRPRVNASALMTR